MKKRMTIIVCCISILSNGVFAEEVPSVKVITKKIISATTKYANSVACEVSDITGKQIAALVPYKDFDGREEAEYAVLWNGDLGCAGGSGTNGTNIAIIKIRAGDSFVVDASRSSPNVTFDIPVRGVDRIVGNNRDSLILEATEYGENDPNCCPSISVRFVMMRDNRGNWKLVSKEVKR